MSEHGEVNGKFIAGFFLGGLLGAILLFFLGTKEGKKTRKIMEQKGRDLAVRGEEIKDQIVEKLDEKKEDIVDQVVEKFDEALSEIEVLQEKSMKTTTNLRRMFKNLPKKH